MVEQRSAIRPGAVVADSNHAKHEDIKTLLLRNIKPIVAAPKPRKGQALGAQADVSPEIAEWRRLLASEEGKEIARVRGSLSELANARQKGMQGLTQLLVRGGIE